jgi:hypothetical protein
MSYYKGLEKFIGLRAKVIAGFDGDANEFVDWDNEFEADIKRITKDGKLIIENQKGEEFGIRRKSLYIQWIDDFFDERTRKLRTGEWS